jgi:hypothetical protein
MHPGRILNATRSLGAPKDWDKSVGSDCQVLIVRDEVQHCNTMTSAWFPTPDEIAAISAGAPVHLTIAGYVHPPVMLGVGEVPV